jgi:CRISPR/Cas system CSM-associated protein Csm4 (group 5 of RAMP superfamily)
MNVDQAIKPSSPLLRTFLYIGSFTIVSLFLYAYASYRLEETMKPLYEKKEKLEEKKEALKKVTKELQEKVSSLKDPKAEEYALIVELGRVPEGSFKILLPQGEEP